VTATVMCLVMVLVFVALSIYINDSRQRLALCVGWMAASAMSGLYQDVLGKEAYLKIVSEKWVDGWWCVPCWMLAIAWGMFVIHLLNKTTISFDVFKKDDEPAKEKP
jgi:hypothetical protein